MSSNLTKRFTLYFCFFIAIIPLGVFCFYGFYQQMDIYGKLDAISFSLLFFISLLLFVQLPKVIFSSYLFIILFFVVALTRASREYFDFYGTYISYAQLTLFHEFILAIKNFTSPYLIVVILFLLVLFILLHKNFIARLPKLPLYATGILILLSSFVVGHIISIHNKRYELKGALTRTTENEYMYQYENPVMYFFRSFPVFSSLKKQQADAKFKLIATALQKHRLVKLPEEYNPKKFKSLILNYPHYKKQNYQLTPLLNIPLAGENKEIKQKKNIIVIVLESFRRFEYANKNNKIGKNLTEIAQRSVEFNNTYSTALTTIQSEQAILCSSLDTNSQRPYAVRKKIYYGKCLPKILSENGYSTIWFHGNSKEFYNREMYHPSLGFKELYAKEEFIKNGYDDDLDIGWGVPDPILYKQALDNLVKRKSPFFAEILTISSHQPFNWNFNSFKFPPSLTYTTTDIYKNYQKALYYADDALGQFWQQFINSPLKDNTIVVITGDHGVPFYPKNRHLNKAKKMDVLYKVPLFFYYPGRLSEKISFQTTHLDIAPTLLSLLNISTTNSFVGRPLMGKFKTLQPRPIFQVGINNYNFKYGNISCISKIKKCANQEFCYQDKHFVCKLDNSKKSILAINEAESFMHYLKLMAEAGYAVE